MTAAHKPCPFGAGKIRVDITYRDTDWGMADQSWEGVIECDACASRYAFVGAGRGIDVIRHEEKLRCDSLLNVAGRSLDAAMASSEVVAVIKNLARELDALPSVAARYRLLSRLGLETATLPTFRKHIRGVSSQRWLEWQLPKDGPASRNLKRLLPVFEHFAIDAGFIKRYLAEAEALRDQAFEMLQPVMSLGPISPFAALAGGNSPRVEEDTK